MWKISNPASNFFFSKNLHPANAAEKALFTKKQFFPKESAFKKNISQILQKNFWPNTHTEKKEKIGASAGVLIIFLIFFYIFFYTMFLLEKCILVQSFLVALVGWKFSEEKKLDAGFEIFDILYAKKRPFFPIFGPPLFLGRRPKKKYRNFSFFFFCN